MATGQQATPAVPPPGVSWQAASAAPHRLFFLGGAVYAVWAMALWTLQQASLFAGWPAPFAFTIPYPAAHGWMMIYGVLGYYIFGFLLTTFPRWLDDRPVRRGVYVAAWGLIVAGTHLFWIGLLTTAALSALGALLTLAGYAVATVQCAAILSRSANPARWQQKFITAGLAAAMAGLAVSAWAILADSEAGFRLVRWIGLDLFLLLVVLTVIYRMVPFFTSRVTPEATLRRSPYAVHAIAALLVLRFALDAAGLPPWRWLADLGLLAVLGREMALWRFWRMPPKPLLVVLYLALGWVLASLALSAGESLSLLATGAAARPLRWAALHALTVGGFGSLLLGISTRVTQGHSGMGLEVDRPTAWAFFLFQLVPLARIVPALAAPWQPAWTVHAFWSGIGWVLVFGWWLGRFGPVLLRPRVDGRPG